MKEITVANDGIVNQKAVMAYAQGSFPMIQYLDKLGVKFEKDGSGEYNMRKVHHMGTYVLPMPEGHNVKKVLYRQLRRLQVGVTNRYMATRLLKGPDGRIAGAIGVNTRTSEFLVVKAKAVILACGAAGRLGLPASGYLFGTYENAAIAATATRWPTTRGRSSRTSNATRSTRSSRTITVRPAPTSPVRSAATRPTIAASASSSAITGPAR